MRHEDKQQSPQATVTTQHTQDTNKQEDNPSAHANCFLGTVVKVI